MRSIEKHKKHLVKDAPFFRSFFGAAKKEQEISSAIFPALPAGRLRIRLKKFIIVININARAPSGPYAKNVCQTFSRRSVL